MTKSWHFHRGRSVKSTGMASIGDSTCNRNTDQHLFGLGTSDSIASANPFATQSGCSSFSAGRLIDAS